MSFDQFKDFFASNSIKKVWHNYGFDRHVVENMDLTMNGFGGDTMHMARLYDSADYGRTAATATRWKRWGEICCLMGEPRSR